jgi:hypothetical protein
MDQISVGEMAIDMSDSLHMYAPALIARNRLESAFVSRYLMIKNRAIASKSWFDLV